jgi:hypothetical protein
VPKLRTHFEQVPLNAVLQSVNLDDLELPYPQWQLPLHEAQREADPRKIQERVSHAEAAIFARLQELARSSNGLQEAQAIATATGELLRIKTEKLKWPLP